MTYHLQGDDGTRATAEAPTEAIQAIYALAARTRVSVSVHGQATGPAQRLVFEQRAVRGDRIVMVDSSDAGRK